MAGEKKIENSVPVATGTNAVLITKLGEQEVASVKDGLSSDSIPSMSLLADTTSSVREFDRIHMQMDHNGYFQADAAASKGVQSDNGSLVYYLPGYSPYASGNLASVDGPFGGQQPYVSSTGYLQQPVSTNSGKSNGFNSTKTNGSLYSKFSNSTPRMQSHIRTPNKVPQVGYNFPATDFWRGYHPVGPNGRILNVSDTPNLRDKFDRRGYSETSPELTRGPRACNKSFTSDLSVERKDVALTGHRDKYNLSDFQTEYENAKFYVIKSYNEDDIHKCLKYDVWTSTPNGNKKLNAAFHDAEAKSTEIGTKCPIFLFFSVNGSGQFVGVAEMIGKVDFDKDMDFWQLDKYNGFFPIKWHIVKDVPNTQLRHIILENNDNRPVTFSRDTQEIGLKEGLEMLNIFKRYSEKTSLLDDFNFYENRDKSFKTSSKHTTHNMEAYSNGDYQNNVKAGEINFMADSGDTKQAVDAASLINQTRNLSLNSSPRRAKP
ncbi:YTH domain-containing protein [Quillaja saponaria]|uniref:YTH domain-containing family protein n=1 Tax=Quillaja saponaria TaxID=32244 RepID=A0AAD7M1K3_QUISA|nr:YTH domain-containing protein [Quillaja saponaria]KAJ7967997.1 YTH domain-containing protein [Quillaja saponaria]